MRLFSRCLRSGFGFPHALLTMTNIKKDIIKIFDKLFKRFSYQGWWPVFNLKTNSSLYRKKKYLPDDGEIYEVCVGAILTQNTSWKNVEKAIGNLKRESFMEPCKLLRTKDEILHCLIKSSGYYKQKTKKLKNFTLWFLNNRKDIKKYGLFEFRGKLLSINGIGRETADSILLYAFGFPIFVIDSYTKRLFNRFFNDNKEYDYDELRIIFETSFKKDFKIFNEFHALIVKLSKDICLKNNPLCNLCPLCLKCKWSFYELSRWDRQTYLPREN